MTTILHDYVFKCIILGDASVGKSCILFQFTDNTFMRECEPTVCVEFTSKIVQASGKRFNLQVWDTSGQARFRHVARTYYRGSACIFITYDVTRRSTFDNIKGWLDDAVATASPGTVLVLLANKCEPESKREVTTEEGQAFANHEGMLFFEVSAKTGHDVQNAFVRTTERVYESLLEGGESPVVRKIDEPSLASSDSLLDKPNNGLLGKSDDHGSLETAYAKLSPLSLFCVGSSHTSSRLLIRLCVLPWQIVGRVLVFCIFMFLELVFILPFMFMTLVQRPRQSPSNNKPQSLNDSIDSTITEPVTPISLPLFFVKSGLSLLFLLCYPLIAIYYLVPIYIIREFPKQLVQLLLAIEVLVLTILLLFGIGRRLQKRKSAFELSRSDEVKLGKLGNFQWANVGNWIVIGILVLEALQVVGYPLQTISSGAQKFFAAFYLYIVGGPGTEVFFWLCVFSVFFLFGVVNWQIMRDMRAYAALRNQGKREDASSSFYFSLVGSVVFGHGKPENISKYLRYTVMIFSDGLFFLVISQFFSIFMCEYITFNAENQGKLIVNSSIECWTYCHYRMSFFSFFSLGYYCLFSGLVSPIIVEGGVSIDSYFNGIYTSAVTVVKLVLLYTTLVLFPLSPLTLSTSSFVAGTLLAGVTVAWMLRTSTPMRQPSASAGANLARAWIFASCGVAGALAYAWLKGEMKEGARIFMVLGGFIATLLAAILWYVRYTRKGKQYSEFSKMANSEIIIEEGAEMEAM